MNGLPDLGDLQPWRYFVAVSLALGLILGLSGDGAPGFLAQVLAVLLWTFQVLVAMGIAMLTHATLSSFPLVRFVSPLWLLPLGGALAALFATPVLLMIDIIAGGNPWPSSPVAFGVLLLGEAIAVLPVFAVAWTAINLPFVLGYRILQPAPMAGSVAGPAASPDVPPDKVARATEEGSVPRFMSLVEASSRGRLLYLAAELHYLRVVTDRGQSLILYNLRDAVTEMEAVAEVDRGVRCHRSYWVDYDAVRSLRRKGREGSLVIDNGDEVPVSRANLNRVSEALSARQHAPEARGEDA